MPAASSDSLLHPLAALATAALLLTACAAGPDYVRPNIEVPDAYKESAGWKSAEPKPAGSRQPWWESYGDPTLNALMQDAERANQNLRVAEAQYREARALADAARAGLFPTLGASGGAEQARTNTNGVKTGNTVDVALNASWEPDLWGSVRRSIESGEAGAQASADDLAAARLSIQAALPQDYFQLRITDQQRDLFATTTAASSGAPTSPRLRATQLPVELSDLSNAFNGALDRLEAAYQQLEAFNADVAHELRTPLANLIGGTQVALARPRGAAELSDALQSNLEELEFVLDESGTTVQIEGEAQARATINVALFRRALSNLLQNAIEHSVPGSRLAVCIAQQSDAVWVSVSNPGETIATVHLPRLFDRFYRVDASRHDDGTHRGHGLGLAIVKAVANMHGGAVSAVSTDGVTTVAFSVPGR